GPQGPHRHVTQQSPARLSWWMAGWHVLGSISWCPASSQISASSRSNGTRPGPGSGAESADGPEAGSGAEAGSEAGSETGAGSGWRSLRSGMAVPGSAPGRITSNMYLTLVSGSDILVELEADRGYGARRAYQARAGIEADDRQHDRGRTTPDRMGHAIGRVRHQ